MVVIFLGRVLLKNQHHQKNNKNQRQHGFTLIEIIIAVMILAVSLITLLGMQSSATQIAIKTRNKQEAMLAARTILAGIEYAGNSLKNTSAKGPASEIAAKYLSKEATAPIAAQEKRVPLIGNLVIEYWPMKGLTAQSLQRVSLTISWSDRPEDSITTYYFVTAKVPS